MKPFGMNLKKRIERQSMKDEVIKKSLSEILEKCPREKIQLTLSCESGYEVLDFSKNLVSMMLEGAGFSVVDLGADVDIHRFVEAVKDNQAQIVGLSALLTTTMTVMKDVIAALEEAGIRDKVKVIIGGAPVTKKYADEIGADGYAEDAPTGVKIAKSLLGLNWLFGQSSLC